MVFEIGNYYKHSTGSILHIIGELETTMYGMSLMAEVGGEGKIIAVGKDKSSAVNYRKITKEEWDKCFS